MLRSAQSSPIWWSSAPSLFHLCFSPLSWQMPTEVIEVVAVAVVVVAPVVHADWLSHPDAHRKSSSARSDR
eukprot:755424-Pyramimonas_sp.AAC.1